MACSLRTLTRLATCSALTITARAANAAEFDMPKDEEKGNDRHGNRVIAIPFDGAALERDLADAPELPSEPRPPTSLQ